MSDKNSTLPSYHTKPYILLSLTAISGEFPITQLGRFGSPSYMDNVVKQLKRDGLIRGYYKDKHRGLRLTAKAKSLLLIDTADRFSFFITGISDTNTPKSELTRRLRLHRIAESMVTMQRADVSIFRDDKPDVFHLEGVNPKNPLQIDKPCFYNSREMKELGIAFVKIRGSRTVGTLLTKQKAFVVYNTENAMMKWEYKSEMRVKALMQMVLCRERLPLQYRPENVQALLLGDNMERALEILMSATIGKRNYFILDGNYDNFYYVPNNNFGEVMLKILCDSERSSELDSLLSQNLFSQKTGGMVENDGTDNEGNPVLFAYLMDLPRIMRFNLGLELLGRKGTIICFDFQAEMLKNYCCEQICIETINFNKYERRFCH